jgi:monoterpene epsilon-lactone hydrolase
MSSAPVRAADRPSPPAPDTARPSLVARLLAPILRRFMKQRLQRLAASGHVEASVVQHSRARLERLARLGGQRSRGVQVEQQTIAKVSVEVLTPPDARPVLHLLYVHGGAFAMGSPRTHRGLTRRLAIAAHACVVVPDYGLAPEHPWPDGLMDVLAVYRGLLERGVAASHIVVAGESAGGNLALALAHALTERGEPQPAGIACTSPWADLACTGDSLAAHRELDTMVPVDVMPVAVRMYAGDHDLRTPTISPLYGDFHGLPPLLIHVSSTEVLYDDARRVVSAAQSAGVDAELRVWPGVPHAFPAFADILPEARAAVGEIAEFVARVVP